MGTQNLIPHIVPRGTSSKIDPPYCTVRWIDFGILTVPQSPEAEAGHRGKIQNSGQFL